MRAIATIATMTVYSALVVAALGASSATAASSPCAKAPTKKTIAYRSIAGVPANLLSLDVYSPSSSCLKGKKAPVVMWVHGGGYRIGDKKGQVKDKIKLFSARGYVFVSTNYRLTDGSRTSARYPDHYRDVAYAVAWIRTHVGSYGGDGKRIALLGHSAGADIVSNVATNPRWLKERSLSMSALRCSGPLDTEGFDKPKADKDERAQWVGALGNDPDYLLGTSATRLVKPGIGLRPVITVVRGTPARQKIEQGFADALTRAKVPVTVVNARGLTHGQVNSTIGAPGDRVMTPPLVSFLKRCFA